MEKLEIKTSKLDYSVIENEICNFYKLGYADSSNFMELENGVHSGYVIVTSKGSIEFSSIVGKTKDNNYLVTIVPKTIKHKK